jgi:hypothetical protein
MDLIPLLQHQRKLQLKVNPHRADRRRHLSRDFYCTVDQRGRLNNDHSQQQYST